MSNQLLPINSTVFETRVNQLPLYKNLAIDVQDVNNPQMANTSFLPFLAWELSVDYWRHDWAMEDKRQTIASSFEVHSIKGTPKSLLLALQFAGFGTATIYEKKNDIKHDAAVNYDGSKTHGEQSNWAKYSVVIKNPITRQQAQQVRHLLAAVAPARCKLDGIDYTQALHAYNNEITYNGEYAHGVA